MNVCVATPVIRDLASIECRVELIRDFLFLVVVNSVWLGLKPDIPERVFRPVREFLLAASDATVIFHYFGGRLEDPLTFMIVLFIEYFKPM